MAGEYFRHFYYATPNGQGGYTIGQPVLGGLSATVQEFNDYQGVPEPHGTDDLTQLGDVGSDEFTINLGDTPVEGGAYLGLAQGPNKGFFFYNYDNSVRTYVLATNGRYAAGDVVNITPDDPDDPSTHLSLCFASGTLIATTRGEVAVERLAVGDIAVTASGAQRPIRWLGRRDVDCRTCDAPREAWPVRVRAGAFGVGDGGTDLPERDLYMSAGHPVLVASGTEECLVPIMCLVNGTSIERVPVETVTYWHVELDAHDILLAEGLPAESFLDFGCRPWFENGADHALANPDFVAPGLNGRCRPVAIDGPLVEAERRRLDALFAARLTAQCVWPDPAHAGL